MPIEMELSAEDKASFSDMKQKDEALGPVVDTPVEDLPEPVQELQEPVKEPEPKEPEPAQEQKRTVPLEALQEERRMRRETQERMDAILAKLSEQPEKPVKPPADIDQDPIGAVKEMKAELEEIRLFRQQQAQQAQQNHYVNSVKQTAINQEAEYVKENPDYMDAGTFLMNQRMGQLKALGYDNDAARKAVAMESLQLADSIHKQGRNIPQAIYELAKSSGFTKKSDAQAPNEQARLDNIAKGQKANVSLSNASGVQQKTGDMNAKAILAMDDTKFAEYLSKLSRTDRMSVMGN